MMDIPLADTSAEETNVTSGEQILISEKTSDSLFKAQSVTFGGVELLQTPEGDKADDLPTSKIVEFRTTSGILRKTSVPMDVEPNTVIPGTKCFNIIIYIPLHV